MFIAISTIENLTVILIFYQINVVDVPTTAGPMLEGVSAKILQLAQKQRMNTDIRRNIFCVMITSEVKYFIAGNFVLLFRYQFWVGLGLSCKGIMKMALYSSVYCKRSFSKFLRTI